mmetsp:Transcript_19740/g.50521  ORF Transcript_19740/g.50521 Transcript_19740/m.50521 type:complete len:227 (+) Transcript_19740:1-681(+)
MELRRLWLVRYWRMAEAHRVHPVLAADQAQFWSSKVTSVAETVGGCADIHQAARKYATRRARCSIDCTVSGKGAPSEQTGPAIYLQRLMEAFATMGELERGVRLAMEMSIPDILLLAMADKTYILHTATSGESPRILEMGAEEVDEAGFRRDWVAYLWGSAAALGVETDVSEERAEFWGGRLEGVPTKKDILDVDFAVKELRAHAIEQKIWQALVDQCYAALSTSY